MASKAEKLLSRGRSLEAKGRREKALEVYRDACRAEPYDPDLWTARADAARAMGLQGEAAESLFHVCDLFARGGMPTQALPVVKKVLELEPGHGGARRLLGVLEKRLNPEVPALSSRPVRAVTPETVPEKDPPPTQPPIADPLPVTVPPPLQEPPPKEDEPVVPIQEPPPAPAPEPKPAQEPPPMTMAEAPAEPELPATATSSAMPEPLSLTSSTPLTEEDLEPDIVEVAKPPALGSRRSGSTPPLPPSTPRAPPPRPSSEHHSLALGHGLDDLLLSERLPSQPLRDSGNSEIVLDEDGQIDVVQAVASTLTTSPLLGELDSDLVRHLIDCGKLVHRTSQDHVFRQGDAGTSLYLILSGEVSVLYENRGKSVERELARLRAGAFFGEMALLTNTPRTASVVALKNSDFLEISRKSVRDLIDREPRVLKLLMRFFRSRLVGTLLQTAPLFKPFSREERRDLIARFRLRELGAEHTVIAEGASVEGLYIVLVGRLEVLQSLASSHRKGQAGGDGLSVLLGTLAPGDVFGEMSLLDDAPAMATVRTRSRTWVLLLPRADFDGVASQHPQIREQLEEIAAVRRQHNSGAVEDARELRVEPV